MRASLVAEVDGAIAGHTMLSRSWVDAERALVEVLVLSPMSVAPAHQGRGLGKAIMAALVERLRAAAPSRAHVALIADGEAHRLYAQYGFTLTAPGGVGMQMVIP